MADFNGRPGIDATTDQDGRFKLDEVPAGERELVFARPSSAVSATSMWMRTTAEQALPKRVRGTFITIVAGGDGAQDVGAWIAEDDRASKARFAAAFGRYCDSAFAGQRSEVPASFVPLLLEWEPGDDDGDAGWVPWNPSDGNGPYETFRQSERRSDVAAICFRATKTSRGKYLPAPGSAAGAVDAFDLRWEFGVLLRSGEARHESFFAAAPKSQTFYRNQSGATYSLNVQEDLLKKQFGDWLDKGH